MNDASVFAAVTNLRFALIGCHPDGVSVVRALIQKGCTFAVYAGPDKDIDELKEFASDFQHVRDVEEVLASRDIEAVIVADELEHRPSVLRRAVQSEKHVLCVHPADLRPDIAYEAAMIQKDTGKVLWPLLRERYSPGLARLKKWLAHGGAGPIQQIRLEQGNRINGGLEAWERSSLLHFWDIVRAVGGEIAEVSALAERGEELLPDDQVTLTGRFVEGGLFQVISGKTGTHALRLTIQCERGQAEWLAPTGTGGPSQVSAESVSEPANREVTQLPAHDPWLQLADDFLKAVNGRLTMAAWLDGTRCLELFDAAQSSVKRSRVVEMHYQEYTEEAIFKGLMTSLGCGMLWLVLVMMIVGVWAPWLWVGIPFLLLLFLGLQLFRWAAPTQEKMYTKSLKVDL